MEISELQRSKTLVVIAMCMLLSFSFSRGLEMLMINHLTEHTMTSTENIVASNYQNQLMTIRTTKHLYADHLQMVAEVRRDTDKNKEYEILSEMPTIKRAEQKEYVRTTSNQTTASSSTMESAQAWVDENWEPSQGHLTRSGGVFRGPSGKETYYNLNMSRIVQIMRDLGYSEEEYPYWVREDGCKMLGNYIMVAADLTIRPRGTILETSLGTAIVCDTGTFAQTNPLQIDIAVNW